uniref:Secreted protein n=1 Tax=Heterorhabditis bacteriophora TaxID=37862 RepID=A0A1I7XR86_HETBA
MFSTAIILISFSVICVFTSSYSYRPTPRSSSPPQCYSGWQIWGDKSINNVSLTTCQRHHRCCFFIASLPGNNYGCYSDCPQPGTEACGPDPSEGIQVRKKRSLATNLPLLIELYEN